MAEQKKIKEDIAINKDFDLLTRSYQEHAISQINMARFSVLYSREFAEQIINIFSDVKSSYKRGVIKKRIKKIIKKNGKNVWILISANNKLYGDIIQKSCQFFVSNIKKADPSKIDIIVIGKQGKNYLDRAVLNINYEYFEIPDTNTTVDYLKKVSVKLISYENVYVVYGKFNNLVSQAPVQVALSGEIDDGGKNEEPEAGKKQSFLFEPTIEEILAFFENQILSLLLNQTVQETQLARFASRINAMETAQINIQKQLEKLVHQKKRLKVMEMNKKQSALLAGKSLWGSN